MARSANLLLRNVQGHIGKEFVVKKYGKKTVITRYPDMSGIKPSKLQKVKRSRFAEAVAYAQTIIRNPVLKTQYAKKVKKGQSVYHYAIKEFLRRE
jgi:hypothetical protein